MKVVANIQIYLHAKFHIFLRSLSISTTLFPPIDVFQIGKGILKWKNLCGPYPSEPACFYGTSGPAHLCEADPHRFPPWVTAKRAPVSCRPHTSTSLLHWREPLGTRPNIAPVTAQTHRLPLLQHRRSSPAKFPSFSRPRVTFFTMHRRPSHPLLLRAVISCVDALRHHIPAEQPVLVGTAAGHRDAGTKHPVTRSRAVPLLPPPLLALRAAPSSPPAT
jgi:hypothetical protein